jgi:GNAT superfamily N-acetyltransferase
MSKLSFKLKGLTLRPKRDRDDKFLRMAYESSRDEEFAMVAWDSPAYREGFFTQQFEAQNLHFANFYPEMDYDIIEFGGKPIGRLALMWEKDHLHCVDIILLPKFRKQQIGTVIMQAIEKEIDRKGITASLMYEKWKPYLEKFYERFGFKTTKEYPMHFYMVREKM